MIADKGVTEEKDAEKTEDWKQGNHIVCGGKEYGATPFRADQL